MNENKDSRPVDGKYAGQAKPRNGRPRGCRAITEAGEICGETESLEIIEKFHKLYEERLRMVDDVPGIKDRTRLKVQILSSWVNDLAEQNAMLVKTVEQLEVEATSRVALLEERLQQSSHVALKYMSKLQDCDGRLRGTARETNQSELLKMSEECLRKRIASLQNDMLGLTELIRRAYCDGSWNIDGLNFCEITYEDIFGHSPSKNVVLLQEKCSLEQAGKEEVHSNLAQKKKDAVQKIAVNIKTESSTRSHREKDDDSKCGAITTTATTTTTDNSADLDSAPPKIHTAEYEMQRELNHAKSITKDKIEISKLTTQLEETEAKLEARILEVSTLSSKLKEKNEKIRILTEKLGDAEESCTSIKDSWKAELAKQNEETLSLKQDLQCLEDSVQQANVHTSLKDDIIKEMRKDLKLTRIKDGYQDLADMKSSLSEISTNLQASWGQICSVFKDIPQDYIMRHTDLMEREQCVVKLLLEKLEAVGNDLELQSKMKKGVNFASVSIEEHEKKIEELQKKLKDAQKEVQTVEINSVQLKELQHAMEVAVHRVEAQLKCTEKELELCNQEWEKRYKDLANSHTEYQNKSCILELKLQDALEKEKQFWYARESNHDNSSVANIKSELEILKITLMEKENIIEHQKKKLNAQQKSITLSQKEISELQEQITKLEDLPSARKLLDEQSRGCCELCSRNGMFKVLYLDFVEMENQYGECYSEVGVKYF